VREVRELVFALDADRAGQQQWHQLVRQAALRGKQVSVLPTATYGGYKDVNEAWAAGVLAVGVRSAAAATGGAVSPYRRTSTSPGLSGWPLWSWTAASRARKPSAWPGRGSRPQAPRPEALPSGLIVLARLGVARWRSVDDRVGAPSVAQTV
jgi:hypothetical protein